jgi:hypothetical protein
MQVTLIEAISINYDLLTKSSPDICLNKVITNLWLPMLTNHDCGIATETPEKLLFTLSFKTALSQHAIFHWS